MFIETPEAVASTFVPVVRIEYSQVLCSVYEMFSVVVLVNVTDGALVVFTVKLGLLVLTPTVDCASSAGVPVVLAALQDLQQMRWNAGIMQYC